MAFTLEYVLGNDKQVYQDFLDNLPPGKVLLKTGMVVPLQTERLPHTFTLSGCTVGVVHFVRIITEGSTSPKREVFFVPSSESTTLTLLLTKGVNLIQITNASGTSGQWYASATYYAVFLRAYAREVAEKSLIPLQYVESTISAPHAYRLATPLMTDYYNLLPPNLEAMEPLASKLTVKNLLNRPGSDGSTEELLTAFCVTHPVFFRMKNINSLNAPLFRSEETFAGQEAHVWMPNREAERWRAFIQLLNNIPQLYELLTVNEELVQFKQGGSLHEHRFDFESPFASTLLQGVISEECFTHLFDLSMVIDGEHELTFCQASYFMDSVLPALLSEADPIGQQNFTSFTASGRFEQQLSISPCIHEWYYESPLTGVVDGVNTFFNLLHTPASSQAVKLFVDGLLQRYGIDYRLSSGTDFRSGVFQLKYTDDPLYVTIETGVARPFLAPFFGTLEVVGSVNDLQYVLTGGEQDLNSMHFLISNPPPGAGSTEEVNLHFTTPAKAPSDYPGVTQYGIEIIPSGSTTYTMTFPSSASTIDYQLLTLIVKDSVINPTQTDQLWHMRRGNTLTGAIIELSEEAPAGYSLHWWLIETDGVALERGTITLSTGDVAIPMLFSAGPYYDQVSIQVTLWNTTTFGDVSQIIVSFSELYANGMTLRFSSPIPDGNYRADYCVFDAQLGNVLSIYEAPHPGQIVEAHYDILWNRWINTALTPETDGFTTLFRLPVECPVPESMYLVLNGRLLMQGGDKQYTVNGTDVRLNFAPGADQILWTVYPADETDPLPSAWVQGALTRLPQYAGAYATGFLSITSPIPPTESVTLDGVTLTGVAPAEGEIFNPQRILIGDQLEFSKHLVTRFSFLPTAVSTSSNTINYPNHSFSDRDTITFLTSGSLPAPLTVGTYYYVDSINANSFRLSRTKDLLSVVDLTTQGSGEQYVIQPVVLTAAGLPANYNEFPANVDMDTDGQALADCINNHPIIGVSYLATYSAGTGHNIVKAKALGDGLYNETLIPSPNLTFLPTDLDTFANTFVYANHGISTNTIVTLSTTGALPATFSENMPYYVVTSTINTFQLSLGRNGAPIAFATGGSGKHRVILANGSIQIVSQISGDSPASSEVFAAGVSAENDMTQLARSIATHPYLSAHYTAYVNDDKVKVTAKQLGPEWNIDITASWSYDVESQNVMGGIAQRNDRPFVTPGLFYYRDAPVISLDGVSTRLYDEFGGREVVFSSFPVSLQEPYVVSQTYPIEHHPLDDMVANSPCNYSKGLFTQGLFTQGGTVDTVSPNIVLTGVSGYNVDNSWGEPTWPIPYGLNITTDGLPIQEVPAGIRNSINNVFNLSAKSANGTNSLMLWIDGIFQPSTTYGYSETALNGVLTLSFAPTANQIIYVWYLPSGDQTGFERVQTLTTTSDAQTFGISDGPVGDERSLLVFLEGEFNLQDQDYSLSPAKDQVIYVGSLTPDTSQSVWAHYNNGTATSLRWRQISVGAGDGVETIFTIPHSLSSELPATTTGVLTFMDGLCQKNGTALFAFTVSNVSTSADTITRPAHGLSLNTSIVLNTTVTMPSGLSANTMYYVANPTPNTFQLSLSSSGSPIDILTSGVGPHYLYLTEFTTYVVNIGTEGSPNGDITFIAPPEAGRIIEVAYLRQG